MPWKREELPETCDCAEVHPGFDVKDAHCKECPNCKRRIKLPFFTHHCWNSCPSVSGEGMPVIDAPADKKPDAA